MTYSQSTHGLHIFSGFGITAISSSYSRAEANFEEMLRNKEHDEDYRWMDEDAEREHDERINQRETN